MRATTFFLCEAASLFNRLLIMEAPNKEAKVTNERSVKPWGVFNAKPPGRQEFNPLRLLRPCFKDLEKFLPIVLRYTRDKRQPVKVREAAPAVSRFRSR